MAQVTAQMVKELRDRTGAGMMECKKALVEADGDMDKAIDILRTRGLAAAVKKEGRETNEGAVVAYVTDDAQVGGLAEVNCETDFVGTNEKFLTFANNVVKVVAETNPADVDELKEKEMGDSTVGDALIEQIHVIGENMQIARIGYLEGGELSFVDSYIHAGGKIGVLVKAEVGKAETRNSDEFKNLIHDVAMHIAATAPISVSREDVDPDVVEHEKSIYKAQAAESGKPDNIQEKIAVGRLEKFFKQSVLLEQEFVKDPDVVVKDLVAKTAKDLDDSIEIVSFLRFVLGEEF